MKLFKQVDYLDCGLAAIKMFHHYYFHNLIDLEELRNLVHFDKFGVNLLTLKDVASQYGLLLNSFSADLDDIWKAKIKKPFIISIISNQHKHFVVVKKVFKNKLLILDPANGKYFINKFQLSKCFANVLITVQKIFNKSKKNQSNNKVLEVMIQNANHILLIILLSLFQVVFNILASFYMKVVLDSVIPNMLTNTLRVLSLCFSFLVIIKITNYIFKSYFLSYIKINIHNILVSSYLVSYLYTTNLERNKISNPEYIRRISQIETVTNYYLNIINAILIDFLLFIVIGSILIFISLKIFLISLGIILFTFIISLVNSYLINHRSDDLINIQKRVSTSLYETILLRESSNNLNLRFEMERKFSKDIFDMAKLSMKINTYNWFFEFISLVLNHILPIVITYISAMLIFSNEMSIGNMMLFLSLISYLTTPIEKLSHIITKYSKIKISTKQLNYVLNYKKIQNNHNGYYDILETIKLNNCKFFLQKGKNILNINEFIIDKSLQIIGSSGSGKTTLLNIIAGNLITSGIYGNDIPLGEWNLQEYKDQIFHEASQYIPSITMRKFILGRNYDNISFFVKNLEKIINKIPFPISLDTQLESNLSNYSNGQKQIIRLLPLLAHKYKYILLDESMNSIDKKFRTIFFNAILDFQDQAKFIVVEHNHNFEFEVVNINEINKI